MAAGTTHDFESAGRAALVYLHRRLGFTLWMLTRTRDDEWIVLQAEDHGYGVAPGEVFRWSDSMCSRMVRGEGPRIAPDVDAVPAYAAAPIGRRLPAKAYVGVPLTRPDGELFGTLCAMDPARQPESVVDERELVELLASMLGTLLAVEARLDNAVRLGEQLAIDALTDAMTGLCNRRAWNDLLGKEEERCRRHGHDAAVFAIDLDGLKAINDAHGHATGDALIVAAADALREVVRKSDVLARLGGDEFGVVAVGCDSEGARRFVERLREALGRRGVRASIGSAMRDPSETLHDAFDVADRRMYQGKRSPMP